MKRLVEFNLVATGQTVLVEVDDLVPAEGQMRVSVGGAMAEKAPKAFDAALAGIRPIASSFMRQVTNAVADADEVQVEFGIKLTAAAGIILASASGEGHCKVSMKWGRKS